jgi:hypothetical protein
LLPFGTRNRQITFAGLRQSSEVLFDRWNAVYADAAPVRSRDKQPDPERVPVSLRQEAACGQETVATRDSGSVPRSSEWADHANQVQKRTCSEGWEK